MDELVWAAQELHRQGLAWGFSGNMSAKEGDVLLISRARSYYSTMRKEDFVRVGGAIPEGASSKTPLHQHIHQLAAGKYLINVHPENVVAVSLLVKERFVAKDREGQHFFTSVEIVKPKGIEESIKESAARFAEKLNQQSAVIVRGEGLLVSGDDLRKLVGLVCVINFSAGVLLKVL